MTRAGIRHPRQKVTTCTVICPQGHRCKKMRTERGGFGCRYNQRSRSRVSEKKGRDRNGSSSQEQEPIKLTPVTQPNRACAPPKQDRPQFLDLLFSSTQPSPFLFPHFSNQAHNNQSLSLLSCPPISPPRECARLHPASPPWQLHPTNTSAAAAPSLQSSRLPSAPPLTPPRD